MAWFKTQPQRYDAGSPFHAAWLREWQRSEKAPGRQIREGRVLPAGGHHVPPAEPGALSLERPVFLSFHKYVRPRQLKSGPAKPPMP